MSIGTVEHILKRIEVATKDSPIAVFKGSSKDRGLDAVFWTTDTMWRVAEGKSNYIGAFYGTMDMNKIKEILENVK